MSSLTASRLLQADPHITELIGSADRIVSRIASLQNAKRETLTFISRTPTPELLAELHTRLAGSTIICHEAIDVNGADVTLLIGKNPRLSFMRATARFFAPPRPAAGIHPTAAVHESATIADSAYVGPGVTVGANSTIGADSIIHANVVIYDNVKVGSRVLIHGGTVIGADGFGYERNETGELEKFPHVGGVTILDDAEIGSNTSIDRGTLEDTLICERARIDNQVHIAHNVVVGRDVAVIAQAMIGGSVRLGDRAWIAPSATIMNKANVGTDATVGLGAVVVKPVRDGETVMGSPAVPDHEFRAARAALKSLMQG
jgi:UDP-3-O-[3-hydroxymyristoyl] glucosamine N-acyltransferase